jgi:putative PIN family toxin of toxin-antitoxin system
MVRVVVDTNVLVPALTNNGKSRKLVLKLLNAHTVILSRQMLAELADVLARGKFSITSSQIDRFLSTLVGNCKIVQDNRRFKVVSEDPDDDMILNAAYAGKADYVVTGDKHLLALARFKKTRIVTVNQMLETIE